MVVLVGLDYCLSWVCFILDKSLGWLTESYCDIVLGPEVSSKVAGGDD